MTRSLLELAAAAAVFAGCGVLIRPAQGEAARQPDTTGYHEVFEDRPAPSIIGEFRTTLGSYLFCKADEYMHGGVVMRAATETELVAGARLASHGDNLNEHHGEAATSVIPERERDPRGPLGDIERETQPFMDIRHHQHRDLKESLPLYRMMTWSDPHFIEAYSTGAYLVFSAAEDHNVPRALDFLAEGLRFNPNSHVLHKDYAHYHLNNVRNYRIAKRHFLRAVELADRAPRERVDAHFQEEMWNELVLTFRKLNDRKNEIAWARRGLERFPGSPVMRRTLKRHGVPVPRIAPVPGGA